MLDVALIVMVARLGGWAPQKLRQPAVHPVPLASTVRDDNGRAAEDFEGVFDGAD